MIVLVVTTVAHGGWLAPSKYVSVDPWAGVSAGPALLSRDDILHPEVATDAELNASGPWLEPQVRTAAGASPLATGQTE